MWAVWEGTHGKHSGDGFLVTRLATHNPGYGLDVPPEEQGKDYAHLASTHSFLTNPLHQIVEYAMAIVTPTHTKSTGNS